MGFSILHGILHWFYSLKYLYSCLWLQNKVHHNDPNKPIHVLKWSSVVGQSPLSLSAHLHVIVTGYDVSICLK